MGTKVKVYTAKRVNTGLKNLEARKAMYRILMRGDDKEIQRTLQLFCDHMMIEKAGKFFDWHIKAKIGALTLRMVKF